MQQQMALEMAIRARHQLAGMDDTIRKIREMKNSFRDFADFLYQHARKAVQAIAKVREKIIKLENAFRTLRNQALKAFTAIVAFNSIPIRGFMQFEQKMANVNTLLETTEENFQRLGQGVIDISNRIGESATSLSTALYELVSADIIPSDAPVTVHLWMLETAARAAKAGMTDAQIAINAGVAAITSYNLELSELTRIYDLQFLTLKKGILTYESLAGAQGQLLPSARKVNEELEVMYGALAFITKQGLSADEASTALARAFDGLAMKAEKLAMYGVRVYDEFGKYRGLVPIMEDLAAVMEGLTDEQVMEVLNTIGFDIRAARAIIPMINNVEVLRETVESLYGSAGSMGEAFKKATDTIQFAFNRTIENVVNAFRMMGAGWRDEIISLLNNVAALANSLQEFIVNNREAIKSVITYVLRLAGTVTIIGAVGTALFALLKPMGMLTAGIALLGAAWYLNLWDIRGWTEKAVNFVLENWDKLKDWWQNTTWLEKAQDIGTIVLRIAGWIWETAVDIGASFWSWLGEKAPWLTGAGEFIAEKAKIVIDAVIEWAGDVYRAIKKGFETGDWSDALGIGIETFQKGIGIFATLSLAVGTLTALKNAIVGGLGLIGGGSVAVGTIGVLSIGIALAEAWNSGEYLEFVENVLLALAAGLLAFGITGNVALGATVFTITLNFKIGEIIGDKLNSQWIPISEGTGLIPNIYRWIKRARGGLITGPGTSLSDSIPAMLSNGEFVVNARATRKWLPLLEAINSGEIQGFASGGLVGNDFAAINRAALQAAGLESNAALAYLAEIAHDTEHFQHIVDLIAGIQAMRDDYQRQMNELQQQILEWEQSLKDDLNKRDPEPQTWKDIIVAAINDSQLMSQLNNLFHNIGDITGDSSWALIGNLISAGTQGWGQWMNFLDAKGILGQINAGIGIVNAALTAVSTFQAWNEERNRQAEEQWNEQLQIDKEQLENIKAIEENTRQTARDIVRILAQNPTMSNIAQNRVLLESMWETFTKSIRPNFGKISVHVVEEDLVFDDKKTVTYTPVELMKKMGFDMSGFVSDINKMSLEQLKEFYNLAKTVTQEDLKKVAENIAAGMDVFSRGELKSFSTNWDSFLKKLELYIKAIEDLGLAMNDLMQSARYESFVGVEWLSAQEQVEAYRKQLEELYQVAGKDINKHKDEIDKVVQEYAKAVVDGGERIITIMHSVRQGFINAFAAGESAAMSFAEGLKGYFDAIKQNIAGIFYDIHLDQLDAQFKVVFGNIIDTLANYAGNDVLGFAEQLLQSSDMQLLFQELIHIYNTMEDMKSINDILIRQFREQAKAAGMTEEEIEEMLAALGLVNEEVKKIVQNLNNALRSAMSAALESGTLADFYSSMGESIYNSAKEGLIKAFMESEVYQKMFEAWFEGADITFTGNLEEDFERMNRILKNLYQELRTAGLDFMYTELATTGNNAAAATGLYSDSDSYFAPSTIEAGREMADKLNEATDTLLSMIGDIGTIVYDNTTRIVEAINSVADKALRHIDRGPRVQLSGVGIGSNVRVIEERHYHFEPKISKAVGVDDEELFRAFLRWKQSLEEDES